MTADSAMSSFTGLSKSRGPAKPGRGAESRRWIEFVEFEGVDRAPLHMRIQDRGAARLQLRVQDVDAIVTAVAAGLRVMSEGGVAQPIPPNFKGALVADANNFFLTPFAPCDGCATMAAPARSTR